jgi:hypothetical protein
MLPGFRFLFAAIVLSLSILVFGLGAAALLRAAHEEFASTPAWRGPPEMVFAQPVETTRPVLALLRVDTPVVDKAADDAPADAAPAAITAAPSEPERIAALKPEEKPEDSPSPETAKPEAIVAESPAQGEAASVPAEPAAAETKSAENKTPETKTAETKIAMSEDIASPANQAAAPMTSEPVAPPASPDATLAATKIATLGGPAVSIEAPRPVKAEGKKTDSARTDSKKTDSAKTDSNVIKKRQQARRAARRRLAARARLTAQLPLQQANNPFGQPAPTIVRRR